MAKQAEVSITGLKKSEVTISIKGTTPLITHKWSEKAKRQMLDKQMKKAKNGKEAKDPEADYLATIYFLDDGVRSGFPAVGFKSAMVRAGKQLGYVMADLKGMFFVLPDEGDLIEIQGEHRMREDMVRIGMGTSDIRFRAEYPFWKSDITILYNSSAISAEEIAKLLEVAGFACGIGEWRPEKSASGSFGLFEIDN